jgi:lysophospholipase L1-like esterase
MNIGKIHRLILTGAFLWLSLPATNGGQDVSIQPKRIQLMGLGDSITEGGGGLCSYLYPLWEKLRAGGYAVDFTGPQTQECPIGKLHHAGYGGVTVEELDAKIDPLYRKYPADIVLLHAGHNHFAEEKPIPEMLHAYRSIIQKLKAIRPDVIILLAQVIESGKLPKYAYIPRLNKEIARLVKTYNDPDIVLVNQASGFDWKKHTSGDKVHPNEQGAERMAQVWYRALEKRLSRQTNNLLKK